MKLFPNIRNTRWLTGLVRPVLLLTLLAGLLTSGCATPRSLSQKIRWYKHHSGGGKSLPCPCGH